MSVFTTDESFNTDDVDFDGVRLLNQIESLLAKVDAQADYIVSLEDELAAKDADAKLMKRTLDLSRDSNKERWILISEINKMTNNFLSFE